MRIYTTSRMAESRMNLAALQQRDPYITDIIDTASQVALYSFSAKVNEWEKTSIEGSLFLYKSIFCGGKLVYCDKADGDHFTIYCGEPGCDKLYWSKTRRAFAIVHCPSSVGHHPQTILAIATPERSAAPLNGFMILNRLGLNNLIEPITKELEFQQQDPFLLYRNAKAIYGIWFYDKDECTRIGQLMNSYVELVLESQKSKSSQHAVRDRHSSESDTDSRRIFKMQSGVKNVDIIQMLSKAQDEYDKAKSGGPTDLKPFIDNPNAAATKTSNLIRPTPLKVGSSPEEQEDSSQIVTTPSTAPISLEALFKNASLQTQATELPKTSALHRSLSVSEAEKHLTSQHPSDNMPPLLKHIMSSGSMVEDIERGQWGKGDPESRVSDADVASHHQLVSRGGGGGQTGQPSQDKLSKPTEKSISASPRKSDISDSELSISRARHKNKSKSPIGKFSKTAGVISGLPSQPTKSVSPGISIPPLSNQPIEEGNEAEQSSNISGDLLTPAALEQKLTLLTGGASTLPEKPTVSNKKGTDVLLTPMAFASASVPTTKASPVPMATFTRQSVSEDSTPLDRSVGSTGSESLPVAALTKEQMQQAMLYLIKNDAHFMDTLHEAYLNSLKELAGSRP